MKRICLFCRRESWDGLLTEGTSIGGIHDRNCACGKMHRTCDACWKKKGRVIGEFPFQKHGLAECPAMRRASRRKGCPKRKRSAAS